MKVPMVLLVAASVLLLLAGWLVDRNDTPDLAATGERKAPSQAVEAPPKYRGTVYRGLEYLAGKQFEDGHWEGDHGQHPVIMTALAGLALRMEGSIEMRIWLNDDRLRADGLSTEDIMKALAETTIGPPNRFGQAPGNKSQSRDAIIIKSQSSEDVLKWNDRCALPEQYENIIVRATAEGEVLRLKDIARFELAVSGKYSANLRKAVSWLMAQSETRRDGLLFSGDASESSCYMVGHGLATLFLVSAWRTEADVARRKKLTALLERAVEYIGKARTSEGGWYFTSRAEGHDLTAIVPTAIQMQALRAAASVRIRDWDNFPNEPRTFLRRLLLKYGQQGQSQFRIRPAEAAAVPAICLSYDEREEQDEWSAKLLKQCQAEIAIGPAVQFGRDELAHYFYAQILYLLGEDTWNTYRNAMFDHVQSSQNKDGSWPAGVGLSVGSVYSTAVWCTILQLDGNQHPSSRRRPQMR
jgi:hypothetical protein